MTPDKSLKNTDLMNVLDIDDYKKVKDAIDFIDKDDRHENNIFHILGTFPRGEEIAKILIKNNYSKFLQSKNKYGRTPLYGLIQWHSPSSCNIAKIYIEADSSIVNANNTNSKPNLLLIENMDYDREHNIETPLIFAIDLNALSIAQLLIENNANLNARDSKGRTALFYTVKNCNYNKISKLLIAKGANLKLNGYIYTARYSRENGIKKIYLFDNGWTLLNEAIKHNNNEIVKILIDKGVDINEIDENKNSPLKNSYNMNNKKVTKLLLENGANAESMFDDDVNFIQHAKAYKKSKQWFTDLVLKSDKYNSKILAEALKKFSLNEKLKCSNHTWDSLLDYDIFIKDLKDGFSEIADDLKILSSDLYQDIDNFLFSENEEKIIGWSSTVVKKEIKKGILPHNISLDTTNQPFKTFGEAIDNFKGLFVVKQNDKKLKLLKKFTKIKKELGLKNIDLNNLKLDKIDKFFTDTKRFEQALTLILKDIQENSNDDKKDILVEADTISINSTDMIEIKIIHLGSTSSKTAEALKETINENGGNFKTIYNNLISVCDWSIDTICNNGERYKIDYLYPEIDNSKSHCTKIDDKSRGFTHILRFYI